MKSLKQAARLLYIHYILAKYGLDHIIVSIRLFAPLRFMIYLNPWNWYRREPLPRGVALRKTLEALGPIFIKFGQALSTRPDILPPDIAIELTKLQDAVPPFPAAIAMQILEQTYGLSPHELFASFDETPLASASIAQVHVATLKTGEEVVVKILRPNIRDIIEQDLSILHTIAHLADKYWSGSKYLKPKAIVKEFEHTLFDELNLRREAANASQLRRNFNASPLLYVPKIYWDYAKEHVLVQERIYGIPVTDIHTLNTHGINIKKLAERGLEIFFTQVFRDCFFHADMHPGNIFVSFLHPDNPQYICVDFGIIGTLDDNDKRYLAENLMAFFNRDYRRVALLHIESGWVSRHTRINELEGAIRTVCEPIFEKPLKNISFAQLVLELLEVARRFHMEVQPQLVLLQKTLFAVEGLGRQLYPDLDIWATGKPLLEKWLKNQMGVKALLKQVKNNWPYFIEELPQLPPLIHEILTLSKEEKIRHIESLQSNILESKPNRYWYQGLGLGISCTLIAFGGLIYGHWLAPEQLRLLAIGATVLGVAITGLSYTMRN